MELMKGQIKRYFGESPKESADFPRIVTIDKTLRLVKLLENTNIYTGGEVDIPGKYISPTIVTDIDPDHPLMKEEIFGPILPVMEFNDLARVTEYINDRPKPLALYYFSDDVNRQKEIFEKTSSGGGCINDVLIQFTNGHMPFGGVGNSGIGGYHGKFSFETFSHKRSIMKKTNLFDIPIRYPPYTNWKYRLVKLLMR